MAVVNERAVVSAFNMLERTVIQLPKVLGGLTLDQQIQKLFANGEQGFFYDPNDLSTMFQDSAGTVPVTGAGQPVGLMFDKRKGFPLGLEKVTNSDFDSDTAWTKAATVTISGGSAILSNASGNPVLGQNVGLAPNVWYDVTVVISELSVGTLFFRTYGTGGNDVVLSISSAGTYKFKIKARSDATGLIGFGASATSAKIDSVSVKEIAGNHAYQTTSSMRPLLVASPQRLDYDTVDDKLITDLPAQLTGCTVVRAVPNVGTQILTGQTVSTPYNDSTDHCGLVVINRALTPNETSAITAEFNKRVGV